MKAHTILTCIVLSLLFSAVRAQDVSREEFDRLKKSVDAMQRKSGLLDSLGSMELSALMLFGVQGTVGADETVANEGDDETDAISYFGLDITTKVGENGKAYALLEVGDGAGIDDNIPTFSGLNDNAENHNDLTLSELWYRNICIEGMLDNTLGKLDMTNYFGVVPVKGFLSTGFVNHLGIEFPDDNSFGLYSHHTPLEFLTVEVGFADARADWDNVFEKPFVIGQATYKQDFGGTTGEYSLYAWRNYKNHVKLKEPNANKEDGFGWGVSASQTFGDILAFGHFGYQRDDLYQVSYSHSLGAGVKGKLFGREDDLLGAAYGVGIVSDDYGDNLSAAGISNGEEYHVEVFYEMKVNDNFSIKPDIQWVRNPAGVLHEKGVWALGLEIIVAF